jgi:hypothetical protein
VRCTVKFQPSPMCRMWRRPRVCPERTPPRGVAVQRARPRSTRSRPRQAERMRPHERPPIFGEVDPHDVVLAYPCR